VIAQDSETNLNLFGFSQNTGNGFLTALPGITINPGNVASTGYPSGVTAAGIIVDAAASHLYITDQATSAVLGYSITANGVPGLIGSARTDSSPAGMTIDMSGKYLYVASNGAGSINGFTFAANGAPVTSSVASSVQAGTGPTCLSTIGAPSTGEPTHAVYLYASNQLSNNVTGTQLSPSDGSLKQIQNTPFSGNALPTCLVAVPVVPGR
jgi:6-phosphogluconolactonase (cycloisomerase 2 family)